MRLSLETRAAGGLKLTQAVLLYGNQLAMVHGITHGNDGGVALAEGKPLSLKALAKLAKPFEQEHVIEVLPPEMLARTPDLMAWECHAKPRTMHYGEYLPELDGQTFPQPNLVWAVRNDGRVFVAAHEGNRPFANTPLLLAPYWNTNVDGAVCWGQGRRPEVVAPHSIREWETCFYSSVFSHPGAGRLLAPGFEFVEAWRHAKDIGYFPDNLLVTMMGKTLGQWLKEIAR